MPFKAKGPVLVLHSVCIRQEGTTYDVLLLRHEIWLRRRTTLFVCLPISHIRCDREATFRRILRYAKRDIPQLLVGFRGVMWNAAVCGRRILFPESRRGRDEAYRRCELMTWTFDLGGHGACGWCGSSSSIRIPSRSCHLEDMAHDVCQH